jgi:sec-independent protein translocase protein TatC
MPDDREWPDSGAREGDASLPDDADGFAFVGDGPDDGEFTVDLDDADVDWADPDSLADHAPAESGDAAADGDHEGDADDAPGDDADDVSDALADAGIDWADHEDLLDPDPETVAADAGDDREEAADDADPPTVDADDEPTAGPAGESTSDPIEASTDDHDGSTGDESGDDSVEDDERVEEETDDEPPRPVEPTGPPEHMEPTPPVTGDEQVGTADGGTTQVAGATPPGMPEDEGGLLGEGPDEDVEMPLAEHVEEMINRLAVVMLVGGVVALAVFPVADQLINYLWNAHIPGAAEIADRRPRLYGPLELPLTEIKIAALAGLILGLPVLVYQSYRFMRPGLYPRERRYYLAAVPTSLVLATVGVAFAHFVVLPAIFAYFTSYTTGTALVAFGLRETFNLILLLMGYMAIVFQIPLLIQLGIMMGLVSREWLEARRLLFWGGFAGLAFLVSPDPTGMAPIIVATTMIVLFEGTLALLRWTGN